MFACIWWHPRSAEYVCARRKQIPIIIQMKSRRDGLRVRNLLQKAVCRVTARRNVPLSLMLGLSAIASLAHAGTLTLNNGSDYFVYTPQNSFGSPFPPNAEVMNAAGATAAMTMTGGGAGYSGVIMIGGSGNDTMIAGTASGVFTGGAGKNSFEIGAGTGNASSTYTITDFNANDSVILGGTFSAAQMLANAQVTNGATTLKLR
jgi:Ca2+-binding RTX toxin-like protein